MLTIETLAASIRPERTVLFLGAGAGMPSGGPSGSALAEAISQRLAGESISPDLMEASSILENRYGRPELVTAVRAELSDLQPTGGLLTLPTYNWHAIYTTNFDDLLEKSYRRAQMPFVVTNSNYDFGVNDTRPGTQIYKIHGSVTHDVVDGHKYGMILTESDYETATKYREAIFHSLSLHLLTKDLLVIGYSLRDPDLRKTFMDAADIHRTQNTPGRLYGLVYTQDPDRALLIERRGFQVAFGGIDQLGYHLVSGGISASISQILSIDDRFSLPVSLQTTVIEAVHASTLPQDTVRLYHGGPATYADVSGGLTFSRSIESQLVQQISSDDEPIAVILGVEGVGKTTFVRRCLYDLHNRGLLAWEHRGDFPFSARPWINVEKDLREQGLRGVLFIDECTPFLTQLNALCDSLASRPDPALRVVMAATTNEWVPRIKSPAMFRRGKTYRLSLLTDPEISELVNLIQREPRIRNLVDQTFAQQSRDDQITYLRRRCSADMFVCLKNIFANEHLDAILLREYARLSSDLQEIYRYVAALQASGARVHRQLIIRVLGIQADTVLALLRLSDGIINEYDIDPDNGIYGWSTRHELISKIIATYKFSEQDEIYDLFRRVIVSLIPTIPLEMRTLRDICGLEFGIGRLRDPRRQIELYRLLVEIAPRERVPRHRLISRLIHVGDLELAEREIREAEDVVGLDPPIHRYKVRLSIRRAETTVGLMDADRLAMLRQAEATALSGMSRFQMDKWAYMVYGDVGVAIAEWSANMAVLDDAITQMAAASDVILDPQLTDELRKLESQRASILRNVRHRASS